MSTRSRWQRADVCRLARGLVPRVAGRDGAAVSPQAAGVRGADQENAQVLRRRARSEEEPHAARLPPGRGRAAWRWCRAPNFVLVRPSELMSRAWMKDAADAHARDCPNIKRIINQFNRISRCASPTTRRCASACSSASSSWRTAAATCRTCLGVYAVYVGLNQWAVQRLKGLWEKLHTKWEKRYARARPALQSQVELGRDARAAALRARVGVAGV